MVQAPNSMGVQCPLTFVIDVLPHVTSKCHVKLSGHLLQELNATRDIQFLWSDGRILFGPVSTSLSAL